MNHRAIRNVVVVTAAATSLVLVLGQAAFATVSVTSFVSGHVQVNSDAAGDFIVVACAGGVVSPLATPSIACGDVTSIGASLGHGSDNLNLTAVGPATFPQLSQVNVNLGDDNQGDDDGVADTFNGSQFRDVVAAGDDDLVIAGPGDDLVTDAGSASGGDGDDVLLNARAAQGGPGDDRIVNLPGIGPYDGGTGYDRAVLDLSTSDLGGLVLFGDTYTDTSTTITIFDGVTTVQGVAATTGFEQMNIDLPSGSAGQHYELDGSAFSGRSVLGTGNGNDLVRTGPGPDDLQAGAGNDNIDSGPGADIVNAGNGNDTVGVRDGSQDLVDCGGGTDTVTADAVDVLTGCESVSLPAPAAPETGKVSGKKKVVKGAKATFTFSSPVAGATFECAVDKGAFKACSSPFKLKTKKLKTGKHTLLVRAVQPAGNVDASPSSYKFKVVAKK